MRHAIASIIVLVGLVASAFAQQAAAPPQAPGKLLEKAPYILGPAAVQQFPEQPYFFMTGQASQKTMPDTMRQLMPKLFEAAKQAGAVPSGPVVLVYHGVTADPNAPFDFEVGFIAEPNVKAAGGAEIGKLKAVTCATMAFTGQMTEVGKAYEALFASLIAGGKTPTMEIRQMMLYFESETSANNMSLIEVVLQ